MIFNTDEVRIDMLLKPAFEPSPDRRGTAEAAAEIETSPKVVELLRRPGATTRTIFVKFRRTSDDTAEVYDQIGDLLTRPDLPWVPTRSKPGLLSWYRTCCCVQCVETQITTAPGYLYRTLEEKVVWLLMQYEAHMSPGHNYVGSEKIYAHTLQNLITQEEGRLSLWYNGSPDDELQEDSGPNHQIIGNCDRMTWFLPSHNCLCSCCEKIPFCEKGRLDCSISRVKT